MHAVATLLVVEDLAPTRAWIIALLADIYPDAVIHACRTLGEALDWVAARQKGETPLCFIDLGLPDGSGADVIRALTATLPGARVIVMTLYDDDAHVLDAMSAGAVGYLLKDQDDATIRTRIEAIEHGEVPISPAISRRILALFRDRAGLFRAIDPAVSLTARETDVLRLIGRGLRVTEAATALNISAQTVAGYLKIVYRKLDVNTRAEAAVEAARRGLI